MSTFTNAGLRRLGHLFAGHDAGHYTLPEQVHAAVAAIERAKAEAATRAAEPDGMTTGALVAAIADAARTGAKFPTGTAVAKADQERQARAVYATALRQAIEGLENDLETAVVGGADRIIAEHLRPALAEVMAEVADAARLLAPYGTSHERLLDAPEPARMARKRLDALAERYNAIRNAQVTLTRATGDPGDAGRYAVVRNADQLLAGYLPGKVPWPEPIVDRLVWFATNGAEVWMPTAAERRGLAEAARERQPKLPAGAVVA